MNMQSEGWCVMLTRRGLLRAIGCGAGVALLAACTPIAAPSVSPTSAPASAQTAPAVPAKAGGTLTLGVTAELPNLESHQMSPSTFNVVYQVHDRLIEYDANRQPVGELAESWDGPQESELLEVGHADPG
jgi:hypothetical protein